ncbi:hypothetical protein [Lysobacter tyrosinilyticus]
MSDISVWLDSIRARIVDRVAQASRTSSGPSENSNGLLLFGIEDEQAFRKALDAPGAHSDSESLSLLDPRCFDGPPSKNVKRAPESGLLSDHQWRRYDEGKRSDPSGANVVGMWRQCLQRLAKDVGDHQAVLSLQGHSEPAQGDAIALCNPDLTVGELSSAYSISADAFITMAGSAGQFCADPPAFVRNANGICKREYTVRFWRKQAASQEIRHYPDHERSTNSTGMW